MSAPDPDPAELAEARQLLDDLIDQLPDPTDARLCRALLVDYDRARSVELPAADDVRAIHTLGSMHTNKTAHAAAQKAGHDTYQHKTIEIWPACTACGTPIRWNVDTGRPGLWRACNCSGVLWRSTMDGWQREEARP